MKHTINFRPYQLRIIQAQDEFMNDPDRLRGTILAATGAGKTECFNDLILKIFSAITNGAKRVLIAHPRIALSQNQQKRLAKKFKGMGVEFTSFHSGHQKYHTLTGKKNISVIDRDKLQEVLNDAPNCHITFSSYKSLHKIADMDFDLIICDEAHYLVQSDLKENLHLFKSKVLFYTGTPVEVAAQEESMTNVDLFGDIIANVPPKELIPFGYIVPPRLRTVNVKTKKQGNTPDYAKTIAEAFKDQLSFAHKRFVHKMLVAMPRTTEFDDIMQELASIREINNRFDIDVYYITADRAVKNGTVMSDRETALEDFDNNINPCIIIHCDTLAEGIDVDGIGGVLIMRGLGMSKAIQTIGRGCRAAKQDIKKNGEIKKHRVKTECIVTLARVDGDWLGETTIAEWAEMFRSAGYGEIWDFYTPMQTNRGSGSDVPEYEDPLYDEIEQIKFNDGVNKLWNELFGSKV
jgi:superfamily II DNA or RNA helicase